MKYGDIRKALIVGINKYPNAELQSCGNDAKAIEQALSKHGKGDPNFECRLCTDEMGNMGTTQFRKEIIELLREEVGCALLFFAGHGAIQNGEFCLVTTDYPHHTAFVPMNWILKQVEESPVREVTIILDTCFSGNAGNQGSMDLPIASLRKGVTILAASSESGLAAERSGHGKFTELLVRGLMGAAMDMVGHVTTASLYAYADSFLSLWEQRPIFKTHVAGLTALRYCIPVVKKPVLRSVTALFPKPGDSWNDALKEATDAVEASRIKTDRSNIRILTRHGYVQLVTKTRPKKASSDRRSYQLTESGKDLHKLVSKNKI